MVGREGLAGMTVKVGWQGEGAFLHKKRQRTSTDISNVLRLMPSTLSVRIVCSLLHSFSSSKKKNNNRYTITTIITSGNSSNNIFTSSSAAASSSSSTLVALYILHIIILSLPTSIPWCVSDFRVHFCLEKNVQLIRKKNMGSYAKHKFVLRQNYTPYFRWPSFVRCTSDYVPWNTMQDGLSPLRGGQGRDY